MRMRSVATILALAPAAGAAVAGVPTAGPAGIPPVLSATTSNDMFANGLGNTDDFRTAGVAAALRWDRLVLTVDGCMLTDRAAHTRSDQAIAMAGVWLGRLDPQLGWHLGGYAGAGIQADGDLGGQRMQNLVHRTIGANEVFLDQDPPRGARAMAGASVEAGWLDAMPAGSAMTGWWGLQLVASGTGVADGERVAEAGPRAVLIGAEGAMWLGAYVRAHDGDTAGPTAAATLVHEDGWWIDAGTYVTPLHLGGAEAGWQVRVAVNPETRAALGSIGLVASPGGGGSGPTLDLQHDLALYGGGGFGFQLRWSPFPWQEVHRSALVVDYRFGTEPDGRLRWAADSSGTVDADLRHDQLTLGWEEAVRSPSWSGVRFVAALQGLLGARSEGIIVEGDGARTRRDQATTGVLAGAGVVRIEFGETFDLGASLDGWLPWWREPVHDAAGGGTVLGDPGWATGLHLAAHVAW